jgi:predicted phage-related endonuclease
MSINLQTDITSRSRAGKGRRHFIGGSDARVIMGANKDALLRLWREKRGKDEPEDLSGNLIFQLDTATVPLNRAWHESIEEFNAGVAP